MNSGTFATISDTNPNCTLSLNEYDLSSRVVFPNPISDIITIRTNLEEFNAVMFDVLGKQLPIQRQIDGMIDTSALSSELYVLKVYSGSLEKTFKLIKN